MRKIGLIIVAFLVLTACNTKVEQSGYEINGIAKNMPDSTVINLSDNKNIKDSTMVIGEKFYFKGNVENPTKVFIAVKDFSDFKFFWLENSKIDFKAEKGNFQQSRITGSENQKKADILNEKINVIRKSQDSLGKVVSYKKMRSLPDSIMTMIKKLRAKELETSKNFIREYPNSLESVHVLNTYKSTWRKETVLELFSLMHQDTKETDYGKGIARFIELNKNPQIGEHYADFEQPDADGQLIKLSDIKGKYILVEFWASWCAPCRVSNPDLVKAYEKYKGQGFEILGVSLDDDKDRWLKAIEEDGLPWVNVSDLKGHENEPGFIYSVNAIPDNFLIDENGVIIGRTLRGDGLIKKLADLFE